MCVFLLVGKDHANKIQVNEAMGIGGSTNATTSDGSPLPAFSEHILKIEKTGPDVRTTLLNII